jgi:hypothetical protein
VNKLVALAIVAAATPAVADPCDVRIKHAPEHVRDAVASWVFHESHCGAPLEVRIVDTHEGLYVFARDTNGRVRERQVPDAQSAGVLIASWAAADAPAPEPPSMSIELSYVPADRAPAVRRRVPAAKTFAMHGVVNHNTRGARWELDLRDRGAVTFGLAASIGHDGHIDYENRGHDVLDYVDMKAMGQLAVVGEAGALRLQWSAALGAHVTYLQGTNYFTGAPMPEVSRFSAVSTSPAIESAAALGVRVAPQWYVEAGALVTVLTQKYWAQPANTEIEARGLEAMLFLGTRYAR